MIQSYINLEVNVDNTKYIFLLRNRIFKNWRINHCICYTVLTIKLLSHYPVQKIIYIHNNLNHNANYNFHSLKITDIFKCGPF